MGDIQYPYQKQNVVQTTPLHEDLFNKIDDQLEGVTERVGGTWTDATRPAPSAGVPHPKGWNGDRGCYEYFDGEKWCSLPSASQAPAAMFNCAESVSVRDWVAAGASADVVVPAAAGSVDTAAIGVVSAKPSPTKARVLMGGVLGGFIGLSSRDRIFLGTTPGAHVVNQVFDPIPPGFKVIQKLGVAMSATFVVIALGHTIQIE